jgi:chorismate mutase
MFKPQLHHGRTTAHRFRATRDQPAASIPQVVRNDDQAQRRDEHEISMSGNHRIKAIRGATTVEADDAGQIREATRELLDALATQNDLDTDDITSAIFTLTTDLRAEFPARAARELGWVDVPLLCTVEIDVPGALSRCIRVLLHVYPKQLPVRHVYLRRAVALRPDLGQESSH